MGSADYKQIMPFNSYIDVFNFTSHQNLAEYLKTVSSNEKLYNSYFDWKKNFCSQETGATYFCNLCEKLNRHSNTEHKDRIDLIDWWYRQANCKHII